MSNNLRNVILIFSVVTFIGCAGGKSTRWGHFHGNLSNQGVQLIESGYALSSSWISNPYPITSSSPVIGSDFQDREVVYVGTSDGLLVAIRSEDGSEKWKKPLGADGSETRVISSPSVSSKRDIYVISNRKAGDGPARSTLHKIDQFGNRRWSYPFPDNGFTAGSPKVMTTQAETLIFVYLAVGMIADMQGELFVLRDEGKRVQLVDRKALGTCSYGPSGSGSELDDLLGFYEETWNLVGNFPVAWDEEGMVLSDRFIDPTVAVVSGREKPIIAIADNLCSIGAYEWSGSSLSVLWHHEHSFDKHSSAAVSSNGLMVFGSGDGKVQAYDVETGVKMWEYNAGQPVFATPGIPGPKYVFVVSKDHIQKLNISDGILAQDDKSPGKLPLLGATHTSPAVTANRIYVSAYEMLTVTYDLKTRGHDTNFHGNGLSSVAVGPDGSVYGVASDGTIYKYAGTQ
ncbi:MAG: PQQ-binding-like beta-propeller repeat protein [Deltaproteobacteria bacterium]|nr:PQQ-binding-like beta-propeller repeat protein [Deltaproteobacteria bacterium]